MSDNQLTFKFILVGDSGVGKTSMCKMFCESVFEENQTQTIGLEFARRFVDIRGTSIKIQFWDTAGQERFRSITKSYFRSAAAVFVVYDVTNRNTFNSVVDWINDAVNLSPPKSVKVMVGNKTDLLSRREVPGVEAKDLAEKHGFAYFETSALSGEVLTPPSMQYSSVSLLSCLRWNEVSAALSSLSGYDLLTRMMPERVSSSAATSETARRTGISSSVSFLMPGTRPHVDMVIFLYEIPKPSSL